MRRATEWGFGRPRVEIGVMGFGWRNETAVEYVIMFCFDGTPNTRVSINATRQRCHCQAWQREIRECLPSLCVRIAPVRAPADIRLACRANFSNPSWHCIKHADVFVARRTYVRGACVQSDIHFSDYLTLTEYLDSTVCARA